jgi:hypothetical protein
MVSIMVQGSRFKVQGSRFRVQGSSFTVHWGSRFRSSGACLLEHDLEGFEPWNPEP